MDIISSSDIQRRSIKLSQHQTPAFHFSSPIKSVARTCSMLFWVQQKLVQKRSVRHWGSLTYDARVETANENSKQYHHLAHQVHPFILHQQSLLTFFFLFISISETKVNQHSYSQIQSKADQFRSIFALASALYISNLPTSKILYHISQHGRISRGREEIFIILEKKKIPLLTKDQPSSKISS